jgi:carbon storage regulator
MLKPKMESQNLGKARIMLVLSRRIGETVVIAEKIRVTVLRASSQQVRLGVDAPTDIRIQREEVCRKTQAVDPPLPEESA